MKANKPPINMSFQHITELPFYCNDKLEVFIVLRGSIRMSFISGTADINKGDIEIIGINEPTKVISSTEDCIVLIVEFDKDYLKQFYDEIDYMIFNCNNFDFFYKKGDKYNNSNLDLFKKYLAEILLVYKNCDYKYDKSIDGIVEKAFLFAVDKFDNIRNVFGHYPDQETYKERFKRIDVFFMKNISNKITLNDIAQKEYLSLNYLSNEFKNKLNKSFNEILNYYRIKYSIRFLLEDHISISEISYLCGFTAKKYYYKYFKQYLHCTPKGFKQDNLIEIKESMHYEVIQMADGLDMLNSWMNHYLPQPHGEICHDADKGIMIVSASTILDDEAGFIGNIKRLQIKKVNVNIENIDAITELVHFMKKVLVLGVEINLNM